MSEHTTYAGFAHHLGHERPDHLAADVLGLLERPRTCGSVTRAVEIVLSAGNRRSVGRNDG